MSSFSPSFLVFVPAILFAHLLCVKTMVDWLDDCGILDGFGGVLFELYLPQRLESITSFR